MKILQLVTERQYRGAEVFAANLSQELIELGHEILFVGLYKNEKDILTVSGAYNTDLGGVKSNFFSITIVKRLIQLIKDNRPDIVQCNGSDTLKYMVAASLFIEKIPIVYRNISMISEWVNGYSKKILYKYFFKRIDHVTSVGEEAIEDFINVFGYQKSKTSVIRRGIPITQVNPNIKYERLKCELGIRKGDKIAVHVGNFSPEKNHNFLVDLFNEIKKTTKGIKLICIGNGKLFSVIQNKIKINGLEDTIFLLGFRKDIPDLLAISDCLVLSSKVEGVPGVILEAAAQKKSSVAINVGGVPEVLKNNQTGFLVNGFEIEEFKQKLLELLNNDRKRRIFGEGAYKLVCEEFNPVQNAKKFESLYMSLIRRKPEKLKVLQVIQKKQFRGAEVFSAQLSNHLLNLGQEVEVLSIFGGNSSLPFNGTIASLDRFESKRYFDFKGWMELADYIKIFQPDVIQANAADTLKYTVFSKLLFRWKTPIVYRNASMSSYYINNKFSRWINLFLLKKVDLIISVSKASKLDLNRIFPFTIPKSVVIPVGIERKNYLNINSRISNAKLKQRKKILHIGSFTREKNHSGLLRIFEQVLKFNSKIDLILVGEGPLKPLIVEKVKQKGLEKNVFFIDVLQDPLPLYSETDVLVLPSKSEGLPGVILEGMYYKVPIVAYNVGGVSEIVNNTTGTLIAFGDEDLFAQSILQILKNPDNNKINTAFEMVQSKYANNVLAKRFLKCYYSIQYKEESLGNLAELIYKRKTLPNEM